MQLLRLARRARRHWVGQKYPVAPVHCRARRREERRCSASRSGP
jgi:hypothetical protein